MIKRIASNKYGVYTNDGKRLLGMYSTRSEAHERKAAISAKLERLFLYGSKV